MSDFDFEDRVSIPRFLIEVIPGEPWSRTFAILEEDGTTPVAVADATQWSAEVLLRTQVDASDVLHTFTSAAPTSNISITQGSAGAVVLSATATETAAWQAAWTSRPREAVGDVFVTDAAGEPHCIADLVVSLLPRSTR